MTNVLRWLAVLPCATLAGLIAQIAAYIGARYTIGQVFTLGFINEPEIIATLATWGAFVVGGASVAPKAQNVVAIILAVIAVAIEITLTNYLSNQEEFSTINAVIANIACVVGTGFGIFQVNNNK